MIHLVLLSGGSGTRLWPLSNSSRSKQFLKVLRDAAGRPISMAQRVFGQIARIGADKDITIATNASQRDSIRAQVGEECALVFEPQRRDTAPAIFLACEHLRLVQGASLDDTVIVCPVDSYTDQTFYDSFITLDEAVRGTSADLVLLGATPTYPSSKYGYIIPQRDGGTSWPVMTFKEKPDESTAAAYISEGGLWNCGVFAFRLSTVLGIAEGYLRPHSFDECLSSYSEYPKTSFDYGVVERCQSIRVVPYTGMWMDLGTWNTLSEEMAESYSGHVIVDEKTVQNVNAINETDLPLVIAGLEDAVVVATSDGILVSGKEASANIKAQIQEAESSRPMYEHKSWGEYRVLSHAGGDDDSVVVKEVSVRAGGLMACREIPTADAVITILSGRGIARVGGEEMPVTSGSVVKVPRGASYSLGATSALECVEVLVREAGAARPLAEADA